MPEKKKSGPITGVGYEITPASVWDRINIANVMLLTATEEGIRNPESKVAVLSALISIASSLLAMSSLKYAECTEDIDPDSYPDVLDKN